MQLRSGTCASSGSSFPVCNSVLLASWRCCGLILEPVGAGSHDDLVTLLFAQAIFGQYAALVLGTLAGLGAAARLDAFLLDQFVGREIRQIVERQMPALPKVTSICSVR